MIRKKKLLLNTVSGLTNQIVTLICGFIIPRLMLSAYGSEVNGLVTSITQFLSFVSLAECGVGAVVQSALYKPLAEKSDEEISKIIVSSERFFKKIAAILVVYVALLCVLLPSVKGITFGNWYTISLILIISISSFAQYYFGMTYRLLLSADQLGYIPLLLQMGTLVVSTVMSVVLISLGSGIHVVKLVSTVAFLMQPVVITFYIKKNYRIDHSIILKEEPIKQKWSGLAQHISYVVLNSTDIIVLTVFSTLIDVSIYNIYNLVASGIKNLINSTTSGVLSLLGNMYARNEKTLEQIFSYYEWVLHTCVTLLFACTARLIVPFVMVYTKGIEDANYGVPLFGLLITMAQAVYCLRLPYNMMVLAAGHYKQTQNSAIIEAVINIVMSVILVNNFGLIGVAVGTLVAMTYRTIYLALYLRNNILSRKFIHFVKHALIDILSLSIVLFATRWIDFSNNTYLTWIYGSAICLSITISVVVVINFLFYKEMLIKTINKLSIKFM